MVKKKIEAALNKQLNAELYSSYLYLSMSAYFQSINLPGFANWMRVQTQEELVHAMKFYDFINERGGRALIKGIPEPAAEWDSPLAAFENALDHERIVTGRIHDLVTMAAEEKDHASVNFLQWFVGEQVEEESSVDAVAQQLKLIAGAPGAVFMLDRELGARTFTPPAAEGDA